MFQHITVDKIKLFREHQKNPKAAHNSKRSSEIYNFIKNQFIKHDTYNQILKCWRLYTLSSLILEDYNLRFYYDNINGLGDYSIMYWNNWSLISLGHLNKNNSLEPKKQRRQFFSFFYEELYTSLVEENSIDGVMGEIDNLIIKGILSNV